MFRFAGLVFVAVIQLFQVGAWAEAPTTQPDESVKETAEVKVNGVTFQLSGRIIWLEPDGNKTTPMTLTLEITNHSGKDVSFSPDQVPRVTLKDSDGRELPMDEGSDAVQVLAGTAPTVLKDGQSTTLLCKATLRRTSEHEFALTGGNGMEFWRFDKLSPGKYSVCLTYEVAADPKDVNSWSGKAVTPELAAEITDHAPAGRSGSHKAMSGTENAR